MEHKPDGLSRPSQQVTTLPTVPRFGLISIGQFVVELGPRPFWPATVVEPFEEWQRGLRAKIKAVNERERHLEGLRVSALAADGRRTSIDIVLDALT